MILMLIRQKETNYAEAFMQYKGFFKVVLAINPIILI
jgi:hypothetical protein